MNNAAAKACVQVFVWICVFTSLGCALESEMQGYSGRLESPCEFYDQFVHFCKKIKSAEILIGIVLNLHVDLRKHLQCSEDKFFTSLVKYIPKYIILFIANINRLFS